MFQARSLPWRRGATILSLVALAALAGCVVVPARGYYASDVVMEAPPAPLVEPIGVAPVAGYVWLGGYWGWGGGRYAWRPGRWVAPRPGYYWQPHAWVRADGGWRMRDGRWARR